MHEYAEVEGQGRLNSLTPAEWKVALLIGGGHTNREAADELYLSRYTIDTHLRHIFQKLGIRSRVQLGRMVLAEQLEPSPDELFGATTPALSAIG